MNPPVEWTNEQLGEQLADRAEAGDRAAKEKLAALRKRSEFIESHLVGWYSKSVKLGLTSFTFGAGHTDWKKIKYSLSSQTLELNAPPPLNPPTRIPKPEGEWRTWTSTSGTHLEAICVSHKGQNVTLKKRDGTTVTLSVLKLSDEDRKWLGSHPIKE